ncbi:MAG: hypothetical protein Q4G58_04255 [bacterium]|nr:hypothetical protein [bacterium]
MFNFKKVASAVTLAAVASTTMLGCARTTSTTTTTTTEATKADPNSKQLEADNLKDIIPEQTLKLDVYTQTANYNGMQTGWFAKIIKDKFNVELNIISDANGIFDTLMEKDNLGDIVIFGDNGDKYKQAATSGKLYDWDAQNEHLCSKYAPYIWNHMQTALEQNRGITKEQNKIYGYGYNVASSSDSHGSFFYHPDIRWDLYEQIGMPEVKTLEDYIPVLKKMQEICPKSDSGKSTYGVSLFKDWDDNYVMYVKATAALYGYDEFGFGLYDVDTQTFQGALEKDGMYLRCLKFYNKLYQEGLLDPDSMTQTATEAGEKFKDGAAFFDLFTFNGATNYNSTEHLKAGKGMFALPAADSKTICYGNSLLGGNRQWCIGAKCSNPELAMAIINYLATPEGTLVNYNGPKGVCWDYDENGDTYLTELGLECKKSSKTELNKDGYTGQYGDGTNQMNITSWSIDDINPDSKSKETYNYLYWKTYLATEQTDIQKKWEKWNGGYIKSDEYIEQKCKYTVSPLTSYVATEKDESLKTKWEQVKTCIRKYTWNAIFAKNDDEYNQIVDKMISEAKGYGYDECTEFQQKEAEKRKQCEDAVKSASTSTTKTDSTAK